MSDKLDQAIESIEAAASTVLTSGVCVTHSDTLAEALRDVAYALIEIKEEIEALKRL
jgi:hypothetical protein